MGDKIEFENVPGSTYLLTLPGGKRVYVNPALQRGQAIVVFMASEYTIEEFPEESVSVRDVPQIAARALKGALDLDMCEEAHLSPEDGEMVLAWLKSPVGKPPWL